MRPNGPHQSHLKRLKVFKLAHAIPKARVGSRALFTGQYHHSIIRFIVDTKCAIHRTISTQHGKIGSAQLNSLNHGLTSNHLSSTQDLQQYLNYHIQTSTPKTTTLNFHTLQQHFTSTHTTATTTITSTMEYKVLYHEKIHYFIKPRAS